MLIVRLLNPEALPKPRHTIEALQRDFPHTTWTVGAVSVAPEPRVHLIRDGATACSRIALSDYLAEMTEDDTSLVDCRRCIPLLEVGATTSPRAADEG